MSRHPKLDLDGTRDRLIDLGLLLTAEQLVPPALSRAVTHGHAPHQVLDCPVHTVSARFPAGSATLFFGIERLNGCD